MPPKPRRSVSRTNSSASQLERAKSAPVGQLRPEAELHTRVAGLEDAERRRLCRALGIEGANPTLGWQALSEHVALLESTPLKELRETALRLGAEATELDRAIEQAEDRKSTALDLVLAAGQRARPPARPPPQLPDRPQDASPPAQVLPGALSTRDDHADDDHEHAAALMAWYRAYDPPKADPQHVARVIRMFKKRARRLAANGSAPADWRLMMHAKFEEHNQVDPRDLLNRPVEPQPHLRPAPREAEAADGDAGPESTIAEARRVVAAERTQCSMELNGMLEDSQSERLGAIPAEPELEPEPQPVHGTMPVEPEPEPADGPTRIPSEPTPDPDLESEPHVDAEQSTEEAVPPRQNHAPAGEPAPSTTTRQEPPVMPEAVPCLTPKELKSISGRWLARGMDADGPGLDEGLLLAVSVGGTVACTIDGDADDNCTIRNARIDPASGWCEMEQVYEVGASTHWRCRYDPSTKHFVEGEWHADGKAIGTFTMEPEPPRKPGQPPRFVTQRKQQPGGELLIKWEVGRELGKGHFATAYEITKLEDRSLWAAKVVSKKSLRDFAGRPERFKEELDIHASLVSDGVRHPNVLFMESFFEDDDFYYIVLEICPYESLLELLAARRTLTEYEVRYIMKQIVSGMIFCHSRGVLHRDLKPANILLGEDMTVKVADFGYAKQLVGRERRWSVCGTPNYMPPEVVCMAQARAPPGTQIGPGHGTEADVWCIGIIMYVLLCGIPPFQAVEMTIPATYANIINNRWSFARQDAPGPAPSAAARDLITKLLAPNPSDRIDLPELLMHPWIKGAPVPRTLPVTALQVPPQEALAFVPPELPTAAPPDPEPELHPEPEPEPELKPEPGTPHAQNNVVMGPASPGWVEDASVAACSCGNKFGMLTCRRHHCRACGRIFCERCSGNIFPLLVQPGSLDKQMKRVCNDCYTRLMEESLYASKPHKTASV